MDAESTDFFDRPEVRNAIADFEKALFSDRGPRIEHFSVFLTGAERAFLVEELIHIEVEYYGGRGGHIRVDDYLRRFPELLQDQGFRERLRKTVEEFAGNQKQQTDRNSVASHDPQRSQLLAGEQLLFGIIALQNSVITREQFLAAFDCWVHDKSRRLSEVLEEQRAISAADRELLERLVDIFLRKHGGDVEKSLAAVSSIPDVKPDLERLGDHEIQASLGHVGQSRMDIDTNAPTLLIRNESFGRFRILRPHAKGGLGQISVALDQEIHREVALKEILPQHLDPVSRERFVLEAEITGALEHPGIVPVYALGQTPDGRPYYAMRFVKGDSLKTAIEQYHDPNNPNRKDQGARQLELRQLLGRFIDVCNAIEYAHSRGVLHRDLKPGNIMVGKYGETLVVDWGLAKVVGRKEVTSDEVTLRPTSSLSSSGQTQPGSAIGTPAYMSPEQAAGKLDDLGPMTDVYSLGATLYHLLTGKPPLEKQEVGEILQKIQRGEFLKPRSVAPEIPKTLEAICLKAMSVCTKERYSTPRAMADDIEHWLADEPVSAAPDQLGSRFSRWGRKNRGWVQAGALALIVISTIATASAVWINFEREKANQERIRADRIAELEREQRDAAVAARSTAEHERQRADQTVELEIQQRKRADENAELERGQRQRADENERAVRRTLYAADMNLAQASWESNSVAATVEKLQRYAPGTGQEMFRGFEWYYWDRLCHRDLLTINGDVAYGVAFSPDGLRIAASDGGTILAIWDAITGQEITKLVAQTEQQWMVEFSPDGNWISSANRNRRNSRITGEKIDPATQTNTGTVWAVAPHRETATLTGHTAGVRSVRFSPDGNHVVSSGLDKSVRLWDISSGSESATFNGHTDVVDGVAVSPDGERIASCSRDGTVKIWSTVGRNELVTLKGHNVSLRCIEFSPDGKLLASGGIDKCVKLWDMESFRELRALDGGQSVVRSVAFSPDGTQLVVAGGQSPSLTIWDVANGRQRNARGMLGAFMFVRDPLSVAFSPDGKQITGGGMFGIGLLDFDTLKAVAQINIDARSIAFSPNEKQFVAAVGQSLQSWELPTCEQTGVLSGHTDRVLSVAFNKSGKQIASASLDKTVKLWDTASLRTNSKLGEHSKRIYTTAFSPNGEWVATGSVGGEVKIWSVSGGQQTSSLDGHADWVTSIAFSPDSKKLASASSDQTAKLWDAKTGHELGVLKGHTDRVVKVKFTSDGSRIATVGMDHTIKLWDSSTAEEVMALKGDWIEFSRDNTQYVTGSEDGIIRIWRADEGHETTATKGHVGRTTSVAASRDGSILAIATDQMVSLRDAITGREIAELKGHTAPIADLAFSPDNKRLASVAYGTLKLWDVSTRDEPTVLSGHNSEIVSLAFSSDGRRIASLGWCESLKIWDIEKGKEITEVKVKDHMTRAAYRSHDALLSAASPYDAVIKTWNTATWEEATTLSLPRTQIKRITFSPNLDRVAQFASATGRRGNSTLELWDSTSAQRIMTAEVGRSFLDPVFSPDGSRIATFEANGSSVEVRDTRTGDVLKTLNLPEPTIQLAFSPDNTHVAVVTDGNKLSLWSEAIDGESAVPLENESDREIKIVKFSWDSSKIVTVSDTMVKLWDRAARREIAGLKGHAGPVLEVAFSPESERLATASNDGTVKLWDSESGCEVLTLRGHPAEVKCVLFSPDGQRLASASGSELRIWNATKPALGTDEKK